jgi:hypothetical protein
MTDTAPLHPDGLTWTRDAADPSRDYYVRSGPFVLCKARVNGEWVYTLSRVGQLLHSGTREACEAACASFVLPQSQDVSPAANQSTPRVHAKSRRA